MAILAAETNVFPENLLDGFTDDQGVMDDRGERRWWALYTKSRQEKALVRQLLAYGIPFYLPLVPKDSYLRGRRIRAHMPLFSGYVFLFGSEDERVQSLRTNRISRILDVPDQEALRRDLRNVQQVIASSDHLTVERRLAPGQHVRVKAGPMAGLEGIVVSRQGRMRLIVAVNFLQQGASVEIDEFLVEPV